MLVPTARKNIGARQRVENGEACDTTDGHGLATEQETWMEEWTGEQESSSPSILKI